MPNWNIGLLGLALFVLGGAVGLDALGIVEIQLFFRGWWTLLLIVPGLIGLLQGRRRALEIGLVVGGILLLALVRGWFAAGFGLLLSVTLLMVGGIMICGGMKWLCLPRRIELEQSPESVIPKYCGALGRRCVSYDGLLFRGAELTAMAGSLQIDLRKARFDRDMEIRADAVLGKVEILLPTNVQVLIGSAVCLGRVRERFPHSADPCARIVFVDGMCVLGHVEIL